MFSPEDPNNLMQQWPQKDYDGGVERIQGYRFPAPGSRPEAHIPMMPDDQLFDNKKYSHDSRNFKSQNKTFINSKKNPTLIDESLVPRVGSTDRKPHPAISRYDPTGLRATISATWDEMDKALEKNARPDHLVHYEWEADYDKIVADCQRKGIPIRLGRRLKLEEVTSNYNKIKW